MGLCLIPFLICFFQIMIFFCYQHLTQFMAHETLICIQEQKKIKSMNRKPSSACIQRLERTIKGILLWTDRHRTSVQGENRPFGTQTAVLEIQWRLGWIQYQKIFRFE